MCYSHWGLIPDITGTLMLSRLVRGDVMKNLVFTEGILRATEGATLGMVTRLADDREGGLVLRCAGVIRALEQPAYLASDVIREHGRVLAEEPIRFEQCRNSLEFLECLSTTVTSMTR